MGHGFHFWIANFNKWPDHIRTISQLSSYPIIPAISQLYPSYPYKSPFLLVFCCPPALWSGCRSPSWHFQAPSLSVDAANLPRDCQGIAVQRRGQVGVGSFSASHGPNGSCGSCGSWLVNGFSSPIYNPWRIHGAAIYGNMDPINIPSMLAYIPYMDPMGNTKVPLEMS